MEVCRRSSWLLPLLGVILLAVALQDVQGEVEIEGPSESECRPYIEKALRNLEHGAGDADVGQSNEEASSIDNLSIDEKQSDEQRSKEISDNETDTQESGETKNVVEGEPNETEETQSKAEDSVESVEQEEQKVTTDDDKQSSEAESDETQDAKSTEDTPEATQDDHENVLEESTDKDGSPDEDTKSTSDEIAEDTASKESQELPPENTAEEASPEVPDAENISSEAAEDKQELSSEDTVEAVEPSKEDSQQTEETARSDPDEGKLTGSDTEESNEIPSDVISSHEDEINAKSVEDTESKETSKDDGSVPDLTSSETVTLQQASSEERKEDSQEDLTRDKRSIEESSEKESAESLQSEVDTKEDIAESTESSEKKSVEESGEDKNETASEGESSEPNSEKDGEKGLSSEVPDSKEGDSHESDTKEESKESKEIKTDEVSDEKEASRENDETKTDEVSGEKEASKENDETKTDGVSDEKEASKENEEMKTDEVSAEKEDSKDHSQNEESNESLSSEIAPEEDLILEMDIPQNLRPRDHVEQLLKLDREATKTEEVIDRISEITLRELKRLYENAIKPLETLYKYRDLSNRHYGDAEIFSKPLILFMGPWSGGKSSIINYLLNVEYNDTALRTGAEPSPAYFNLLMYGETEEVLEGTQLAADYTFSGLQKFGQGLEERLRGVKLKSKLLEKVNIVEIPGILEVRKQVSRVFPFNDACQWFIDRADIIFLVYDPSKLDVGPETEAILDQLKGREYQTRIVLNKADQVKPEELMRVQGALIWNISPLMSSPQPPVMYTISLWSRPYEQWAPTRLLQAQERAFLRDLRSAVDRRIENKIASARRFAVRVRNHAKMVDCYLTTYYNHKSIFGNRKQVSDAIIEHPQDYHIYEGLSTLTNISRYDLPDPDVYKDFFRLNPLYEFQQLSATCTYFRGCPINKLDVAIAYDLPELVGKHKRLVEAALLESNQDETQGS